MSQRYFNTEVPMVPQVHYCIPPLDRIDLEEISTPIRRKKHYLLHAPRQSDKTSTLKALADDIDAFCKHHCANVSAQGGQHADAPTRIWTW